MIRLIWAIILLKILPHPNPSDVTSKIILTDILADYKIKLRFSSGMD